jgi:D-mannonate dehydratase
MQAMFYTNMVEADIDGVACEYAAQPNRLSPDLAKLGGFIGNTAQAVDAAFLAQAGVTHCYTWFATVEEVTAEALAALTAVTAQHGLVMYNVGCLELAKCAEVIKGTSSERLAARLAQWDAFLGHLSAAGVHHTTFTWEATGKVFSCGQAKVRGGALGRYVDGALVAQPAADEDAAAIPDEAQLWQNMGAFIKGVLPLCAKHKVRLLAHPNDPPMRRAGGWPCLLRSREAFDRLFALGRDSPWLGMEFCCGTWMEGLRLERQGRELEPRSINSPNSPGQKASVPTANGKGAATADGSGGGESAIADNSGSGGNGADPASDATNGKGRTSVGRRKAGEPAGETASSGETQSNAAGEPAAKASKVERVEGAEGAYLGHFGDDARSLLAALEHFVERGKVSVVHLRNCTAPLPRFAETFIDDGFFDVLSITKSLTSTQYKGTVVLDHTPPFAGQHGEAAATAFSIGYIKATLRASQVMAGRGAGNAAE